MYMADEPVSTALIVIISLNMVMRILLRWLSSCRLKTLRVYDGIKRSVS